MNKNKNDTNTYPSLIYYEYSSYQLPIFALIVKQEQAHHPMDFGGIAEDLFAQHQPSVICLFQVKLFCATPGPFHGAAGFIADCFVLTGGSCV